MSRKQEINHDVLTIEEVGEFFRVGREAVQLEIDRGRLPTITIGGESRILRSDLFNFLEAAKATANRKAGAANRDGCLDGGMPQLELNLKVAAPFEYKWPRNKERYDEAYSGTVQVGGRARMVEIGFTNREAAGRLRRRGVVFVEGYPVVEFVAADDFEESKNMVSLIKRENGKRVPSREAIPARYQRFRVEPYRSQVTGPYAPSGLAVVCSADDHKAMVEHALIRLRNGEGGWRAYEHG